MVLQFISGIAQGLQAASSPNLGGSPQPSPSLCRRFPAIIPVVGSPGRQFFLDFATYGQPVGRVVIKLLEGTGRLGLEFESLITGKEGFGYKGSRVFACCHNEWCLLGDLLYGAPPPSAQRQQDWDPWETEQEIHKPGRERTKSSEVEASRRTLHHGYKGIEETQETVHGELRGAVVAVATDVDLTSGRWILGPQFKLCLSDSLIRSGRVLGQVTAGMEVAQRLSQMSERGNFEPSARITIVDCGSC